ncbi:uncharacterized protein DUF3159 [Motilibacter rhizosphaerae]|uniref:Uncharacterized protein DUF3159 n=1 Tax=Motilibacter rhizosphaerae TaxID=598652 RepID=A0A4V2F3F8_9ACTN|nr:DUF3159 domain-containing protein [Motilibacter rhizosphaerae]RZS82963.1 uncharacterized protein DUF3159 [Motilibacter rhizosphaerae]
MTGPDPQRLDLAAAIGGPRGLVESALPGTLFVLVYTLGGHHLTPSLVVAVGSALLLAAVRLAARGTVQYALSGLLGVLVSAGVAWWTGSARDFYAPGLVRNGAFAVVYAGSALARWPVLGFFGGTLLGEGTTEWRQRPDRVRAYSLATWLWAGMFALRLGVQLPFYLADRVDALGTANVLLGVPLYALVLLATLRIVRPAGGYRAAREAAAQRSAGPEDGAEGTTGETPQDEPHALAGEGQADAERP